MALPASMKHRTRRRQWLVIVAVAVALHLVFLFSMKPEYFEVFRRKLVDDPGVSSPASAARQAITVVPVEVENDNPDVVVAIPREEPPRPTESEDDSHGDSNVDAVNILDVVGEAQAPIPSAPGTSSAIVPPRPVEITWPRTEKLGHCLGLQIDIRIRVGTAGEVLRVEPVDATHPGDCTQAAIDAAQRIRFLAGTVDGKPKAMWTQIRIEFRKQSR